MSRDTLSVTIEDTGPSLRQAYNALATFSRSSQLPRVNYYRVQVALDEIITNIFSYGYEGGPGKVDLSVALHGDFLELRIVDQARAFNPLRQTEPDVNLPIENRPIGGLGIHLVRTLVDEIEYSRQGDENHLLLRKKVVG